MERPAGLPRTRERHFHLEEVDLGKRGQTDAGSTEKGCDLKDTALKTGKEINKLKCLQTKIRPVETN
jgi:hypothetical protein